jgi:hypothetical protein
MSASTYAELVQATMRWADHCAQHPAVLAAAVDQLRRSTGVQDADVHNALLAEVLQGVHTLVTQERT